MFTGIVTCHGTLIASERVGGDARLTFKTPQEVLDGALEGDSMSVSGVCLTMIGIRDGVFSADVSTETLDKTTLGELEPGGAVNLEPALRAADRLGGHMVSGHVDGRATLLERQEAGRSGIFIFEVDPDLSKYVAAKGSVCLDGVSMTVNDVEGGRFTVCIIPHTQEITTLGALAPGQQVNIEVDMIARYLERLLGAGNN